MDLLLSCPSSLKDFSFDLVMLFVVYCVCFGSVSVLEYDSLQLLFIYIIQRDHTFASPHLHLDLIQSNPIHTVQRLHT